MLFRTTNSNNAKHGLIIFVDAYIKFTCTLAAAQNMAAAQNVAKSCSYRSLQLMFKSNIRMGRGKCVISVTLTVTWLLVADGMG